MNRAFKMYSLLNQSWIWK